jgi:hypothetical protein
VIRRVLRIAVRLLAAVAGILVVGALADEIEALTTRVHHLERQGFR